MRVAHWLTGNNTRINDELEVCGNKLGNAVKKETQVRTKLVVPQTLVLASTTLLLELVPIFVDPVQWFEFMFAGV